MTWREELLVRILELGDEEGDELIRKISGREKSARDYDILFALDHLTGERQKEVLDTVVDVALEKGDSRLATDVLGRKSVEAENRAPYDEQGLPMHLYNQAIALDDYDRASIIAHKLGLGEELSSSAMEIHVRGEIKKAINEKSALRRRTTLDMALLGLYAYSPESKLVPIVEDMFESTIQEYTEIIEAQREKVRLRELDDLPWYLKGPVGFVNGAILGLARFVPGETARGARETLRRENEHLPTIATTVGELATYGSLVTIAGDTLNVQIEK